MSATEERRAAGGRLLFACVVGLALTAAVFAPGLGEEFTWDDHGLIRTNLHIQRAEHYAEALSSDFWNISTPTSEENEVYSNLYRPVVTLAYIAQYRLFGSDATGYRALSLALHLLCCGLLFVWLRRRLPEPEGRGRAAALGLALGLFALHPSRAEAVSWISGSTELWWGLLFLAAALALDGGRRWTAGALLALALLSKETAIVAMPLLVVDRWLRDEEIGRDDILALVIPVGVAFALRTLIVGFGPADAGWEGAPARVLASAGLYVQQVVAPLNPSVFRGLRLYSCDLGETLRLHWILTGGALTLALFGLSVAARRRPAWRPALADALFFVVPLLPVMNLLDLGSRNLTADRFLYVPMMGMASLLARGLIELEGRRRPLARIFEAALGLVVVGFALVTSIHATTFASSSTLWEYELQRHPDNPMALHAVGSARVRAGLHGSGIALLDLSFDLGGERCLREDRIRAIGDLGWALAQATPAEDSERLGQLERAYAGLPEVRTFTIDRRLGWSVDLEGSDVIALMAQPGRYTQPRALVLARLGRIDDASRFLDTELEAGRSDASSEELRTLLIAARGDPELLSARLALAPLPPGSMLPVLLDELDAALLEIPLDARPDVARYAMGYGPSSPTIDALRPDTKADIRALRALTSPGPHAPIDSRRPELVRLLVVAEQMRALDADLMPAGHEPR